MKFGEWNVELRNMERRSAPMLLIFFDANDDAAVVDLFFHEAYRIVASLAGRCVYWARVAPFPNAPNVDESVWLNPKHMDRIFMQYDGCRPTYSAAVELCCHQIYRSVLSPYCVFVELMDGDVTVRETAAVLALLSHTSRWLHGRRDDGAPAPVTSDDDDNFTIVVALRDCADVRMCATLYSDYLMRYRNGRLVAVS